MTTNHAIEFLHPNWRSHMPLVIVTTPEGWTVRGDLREIVDLDGPSTNHLVAERLDVGDVVELDPEWSEFFAHCVTRASAIAVRSMAHSQARALAHYAVRDAR